MKKVHCFPLSLFIIVVSLFIMTMPETALSAVFNVTTAADFQNALTSAQQNGEDDTINVAAGTYDVSAAGLSYVAKNTAPEENYALTIEGAGQGQTIIDGGNAARCLSLVTYPLSAGFDDSAAAITVRGITFQNGLANGGGIMTWNGGGVFIRAQNANVSVESSSFTSNEATYDGAGLYAYSYNGSIMISAISASSNTGGGSGAGAYAMAGGDVTVLNSVFNKNTVTGDNTGAGLHAYSFQFGTVTVSGSTFTGNEALATDAIAGGLYQETYNPGVIVSVNNTISGNTSNYGGGAYFNAGDMIIANNTISGNHALFNGGGMIFELQGGTVTVSNNIVWGNTADGLGGDIHLWDNPSDVVVFSNNDYADLVRQGGAGTVTENPSNIISDPLFLSTAAPDPSDWDLHLTESSPCIDAGDNALVPAGTSTDRDGDNRLVDGDGNGTSLVDMGSDEFVPNPSISLSTAVLDFATTPGGRSITITNTGTVLAIGAIASADPLAPPFSITADTCSNKILPHLGTCSITVDFDPSTVAAVPKAGAYFAGMGLLFFGAAIAGSRRRRQFVIILLILAALGGVLSSCSGSSGGRTPVTYSDTFDVPSNDPVNPSVTVVVSGSY